MDEIARKRRSASNPPRSLAAQVCPLGLASHCVYQQTAEDSTICHCTPCQAQQREDEQEVHWGVGLGE